MSRKPQEIKKNYYRPLSPLVGYIIPIHWCYCHWPEVHLWYSRITAEKGC